MKIFYALMFLASVASAAPRNGINVDKIYLNEGNFRVGVAVACSSTTWTEALPAGITRRAAILHTLSTADELVCLSTSTTSGMTCNSTVKGIHLEKGGTVIDNSEAVLYCRVATGAATVAAYSVYIYGMVYNDTRDDSDLTN